MSYTTNTINGFASYYFSLTICSKRYHRKQFEDSVRNRFDVKILGPAQWFLQMHIHQHSDLSYTLDQHRYVLNTLQRYDQNSEFTERETPLPPDYVFSKDNRPVTAADIALVKQKQQRLPFCSAVCTLLYLAYNT